MGYGSIVSIFDRLSIKTVLTNSTGSYLGFLATLAFITVCLIILIPPIDQYFKGAYFQSQFVSKQFPKGIYRTGDDLILAMVFKSKISGEYANHSQILSTISSFGYYIGNNKTYKIDLTTCNSQVFLSGINPMQISDCLMIPFGLQYDISALSKVIPILQMSFRMKCDDPFKCSDNNPFKEQMQKYITDLAKNYYYEFVFNSKVLDERGRLTNQFHVVYSTEYQSPDGVGTYFKVGAAQKEYFVDDSILPWWNNRTYVNLFWEGKALGTDAPASQIITYGFYTDYYVFSDYHYSFRYYKKLDFLLGMIGGVVFLVYLMFWIVMSVINRNLQKMRNAQEMFLEIDGVLQNEQSLHKVSIPFYYIATRYFPRREKNDAIITAAEHKIDIVRLIKKLKVTHRSLGLKGYDLQFKTRDVDLNQNQPEKFNPLDSTLKTYQITLDSYQALKSAANTAQIYQNNPTVLALTENNTQKLEVLMKDENYNKVWVRYRSCRQRILHFIRQFFKFFDVFGARPMLTAQPQSSSCFGLFLTLIIIILSTLTFALTIYNMNSIKIITSEKYQSPQEHNYEMVSGKNFRFAFCVDSYQVKYLVGTEKMVQLTIFKQSKKNGYQELKIEQMGVGDFQTYFQLSAQNPYSNSSAVNCFKPQDGQIVQMGGSYETNNQAYFGVRIDPYCSGTPSECAQRKNKTITDFLYFANYNRYGIFFSNNYYSPHFGRLISGIAGVQVSESDYIINASLLRTETIYVSAIELLQDTSKTFTREDPIRLEKTMVYSDFGDRNVQRKGDPKAKPGFVVEIRPNGQVEQVILRSYKIDFLLGLIGGVFAFWYFIVHFFAKYYNSFKVRVKLAQVLHRQDGTNSPLWLQFLYLTRLSYLFRCFPTIYSSISRLHNIDNLTTRQLNYLYLTKQIDTCYKLSSSLFSTLPQKDLSLIYFREKIDQSQIVKPKRISQVERDEFDDNEFLQLDNDQIKFQPQLEQLTIQNDDGTNAGEGSQIEGEIDIDKILLGKGNKDRKDQDSSMPLYDIDIPNKQENLFMNVIKSADAFKTLPQLTLDGNRDVKSITGGIIFIIISIITILICHQFLTLYLTGVDFTISHRRLIDSDLTKIDSSNTLGQLHPGINFHSGENFKFAVSFNKRDNYYPFDVSKYIGPIGIRMMQYTIEKNKGNVTETVQMIQFEPCKVGYLEGFMSPYNDPVAFQNLTLGYCLPDGYNLSLVGTPSDNITKYFKLSIYNKYGNSTGRTYLNSFWKIYLVTYYMSVPRMDMFSNSFKYQMTKFNYLTDPYAYPIEENLTFSKLIYTDKYYSRSRETYNDKSSKRDQRLDINFLSNENTRNLTFYYDGMLDQYMLDYPGGGEVFGMVGGVILLFTFISYSCVSSFNQYRMKYMIGQRLYSFDKTFSSLSKQKQRKINRFKVQQALRKINNFNQIEILWAWMLNPIAYMRDNYNFSNILRRMTLVIDRVQRDINVYNVYKSLAMFKAIIDKEVRLRTSQGEAFQVNLSSVYIKQIFNPDPISNSIPIISKIASKHKLSAFEVAKINNAIQARIEPQLVIGDKVLNRLFKGIDDDGASCKEEGRKMITEQSMIGEMERSDIQVKGYFNQPIRVKIGSGSQAKLKQQQELKDSMGQFEQFQIEDN